VKKAESAPMETPAILEDSERRGAERSEAPRVRPAWARSRR